MKYLNLGCGNHYSSKAEWTNLDFTSSGQGVIAHNLLRGIPFGDNSFDLVYHSHVLEHFAKDDGETLISECYRVLKPGGVLRIAVPDLEIIARNYLKFLDEGLADKNNKLTRANYEWMKLEMYDQTTRNSSGGNLAGYLSQKEMINEAFVFERIGEEGKQIRNQFLNNASQASKNQSIGLKQKLKELILKGMGVDVNAYSIGRFRLGGEIHQWMYDRYSLAELMERCGGKDIIARDAFSSYVQNWRAYEIDGKNNVVRKPDSLFMESIKK